ncbi:MAG: hypothetical protein H7A24_10825 [Leptospiraceae bacterium]|nr:hypothetical protein [Leptospiraceae bacterium]MCP5512365.1 hypothetical protein [Leptospiraceae bacterium]
MNADKFLSELVNFEKTRNSNFFSEYSLDEFSNICTKFLGSERKGYRISIVGTNGKGSVSGFLNQFFFRAGFSTGLYTSPHLLTFTERIVLNLQNISETYIENWLTGLNENSLSEVKRCSYFEFLTLLALHYYQSESTEIQIFEAGLGGRLDATKLCLPNSVVLTSIGMDHVEILGDNKKKILREKMGIIVPETKYFFSPDLGEELNSEILEVLPEGIELYSFEGYKPELETYLEFNFRFSEFIFQTISGNLGISRKTIQTEMKIPVIQGRLEVLRESPFVIFDNAHNLQALESLFHSLNVLYPMNQWTVIFANMKDKNISENLSYLVNRPDVLRIYQVIGDNFSSDSLENDKIGVVTQDRISQILSENDPILVTGSFRLYERIFSSLNQD